MRILLWLLLFVTAHAEAQEPKTFMGYYAIQSPYWPCRASKRAFKHGKPIRISYLANSFGGDKRCLKSYFRTGRLKWVQVHLINTVCVRNRRCGEREIGAGHDIDSFEQAIRDRDPVLLSRIRAVARREGKFLFNQLQKWPNTICRLSPALEHNLPVSEWQSLVRIIRPLFPPKCRIVNNPVGNSRYAKDYFGRKVITEGHNINPSLSPPCLVNLDGTTIRVPFVHNEGRDFIDPSDVKTWISKYASCEGQGLWHSYFNCIEGPFIDPWKRTNCGSKELFEFMKQWHY